MSTETSSAVRERLDDIKRARMIRWTFGAFGFLVFLGLYFAALSRVGFSIAEIVYYWPQFTEALGEFFPRTNYYGVQFLDFGAYWEFVRDRNLVLSLDFGEGPIPHVTWGQAFVTLAMGFAGTVLGLPGALVLGVLGSERVVPFPFNFVFRGIMSTIRAIPALVWALIYIPLGGVSPFTATLAIGTDTMGNLGRLFTDELEEVEDGPIEAIRSTGASGPQTIVFGMLSQVFTPFIAWSMYIFEINVRVAVTMGLIGGGGLGYVLSTQRKLFNYTNMMATILVILLLVISVEMISQRTRSYIRGDGDDRGLVRHAVDLLRGFPRRMAESVRK